MTHRYRVTGIHPVLGYEPGTEFTATLTIEQEQTLIAGGGIARVAWVAAGSEDTSVFCRCDPDSECHDSDCAFADEDDSEDDE